MHSISIIFLLLISKIWILIILIMAWPLFKAWPTKFQRQMLGYYHFTKFLAWLISYKKNNFYFIAWTINYDEFSILRLSKRVQGFLYIPLIRFPDSASTWKPFPRIHFTENAFHRQCIFQKVLFNKTILSTIFSLYGFLYIYFLR